MCNPAWKISLHQTALSLITRERKHSKMGYPPGLASPAAGTRTRLKSAMNIAERLIEVAAHYGPIVATADGFDVIDCQACGFRHIDPLFGEDELKKFYDGEFYESERSDYFTRMEEDKEWWMLRYRHYYETAGSACARPAHPGYRFRPRLFPGSGRHARLAGPGLRAVAPGLRLYAGARPECRTRFLFRAAARAPMGPLTPSRSAWCWSMCAIRSA